MKNVGNENYLELLKRKIELQKTIDVARRLEVDGVLSEIIRQMIAYEISLDDIAMALYARQDSAKRKRMPKYMDPDSGRTWSGVGRMPTWLRGKNPNDYQLKK
ncbi:H-NS histone family protein [Burkholderia seminalis]|uniref:H-NS histone family protein n=1 Tax=Burkholderia seminalis TaxID=488731 RepID=UPI00264C8AB5|nr:H-NS histone family protein [Burkholderia seminalis]MDN7592148.1 H-NS histone family protein [Burkholderia seminalis]